MIRPVSDILPFSPAGRAAMRRGLALPAMLLLSALLAGCGRVDPVHAYFLSPQMPKAGPGQVSLCYNRVSESTQSLQEMVRGVCRDPRLLSNRVNLDACSLISPVEARFECSHISRSLAEERPPMPLEVLR